LFVHDATDAKIQRVLAREIIDAESSFIPSRDELERLTTKTLAWFTKPG
jgi:hypothetical protein